MSKIKLRDFCIPQKKSGFKAGCGSYIGKYKFFTSSNVQNKFYDEAVYDQPALIFGTGGNASIHYCDEPFSTSNDCLVFYGNKQINLKMVCLFLRGHIYLLEDGFKGAGLKHISKDYILDITFDIPSLDQQKKIVEVLDKAINLISLRKKQIEKLNLLIKSQFVEMFGNPLTNPLGWEEKELSKCLINIDNGKSFICDSRSSEGNQPALLKLSAVTYGEYNPQENKAIIDKNMFVKKAEVKAGDLLFTRKNTPKLVGMSAFVYSSPPNLMMPDLIFRLNTNNSCNKVYLWKLINLDQFRCQISDLANGSAKSMSNISKERLLNLMIPVPPIDLQNQFADLVHQIDKQKIVLQSVLDKMEMNYKSLMQQYFG